MFIDNAVEKKAENPNIEAENKGIKSLVNCMETAQLTIEMMQKHAKRMITKMTKEKVTQLIQLH